MIPLEVNSHGGGMGILEECRYVAGGQRVGGFLRRTVATRDLCSTSNSQRMRSCCRLEVYIGKGHLDRKLLS